MTSTTITNKAVLVATFLLVLGSNWQHAAGSSSVSAVVDLSPASALENTFDVNVSILNTPSLSDTQEVIYTGVLRPTMDIDFADLNNPVVHSLDFHGQNADIEHTDATFTVSLGQAVLTDIAGSIYTPPTNTPAPVTGNTYSSADHEIIAWQGMIDVTPLVGSTTSIDVSTSFFKRSLGGVNDSTINIALDSIVGSIATYDLELITPLNQVVLRTGDMQIDETITITIDGNLVARGQFTHAIPEPSIWVLISSVPVLIGRVRRIR